MLIQGTDAFWVVPFLGCFAFLIWAGGQVPSNLMPFHVCEAYYYAVDHGNLLELTGLPNGDGLESKSVDMTSTPPPRLICGVSEPVAATPYLYLCPVVSLAVSLSHRMRPSFHRPKT